MKAPNYALALALAEVGWTNSETARRINSRAMERGHHAVAVDRSRVSRWIRRGEKPRAPVPALLAEILTEQLGRHLTPQLLGIGPAHGVLVLLDPSEHRALTAKAAAANLPLEQFTHGLIQEALTRRESSDRRKQIPRITAVSDRVVQDTDMQMPSNAPATATRKSTTYRRNAGRSAPSPDT
ncbi:hypothetical protein [Streptomyces sp. NPDC057257]|uniref:hypothetical protein n=1 Tax=Streptomyces sp. NPDC057257 TaxID=3346071 RepID=UPI00362B0490